jgi:hypothetical protein
MRDQKKDQGERFRVPVAFERWLAEGIQRDGRD